MMDWRNAAPPVPAPDRLLDLFENRIYTSSFKHLSGWDEAASKAPTPEICLHFSATELRRYMFDSELPHESLGDAKSKTARLASLREVRSVEPDNILLTPGATAALSVVLHFLRASRVEVVVTDPPFYFSIKKLSAALGLDFVATAKSLDDLDDFNQLLTILKKHRGRRRAVIMANPRYVVSRNWPKSVLATISQMLRADEFLVLDQSVDMEFDGCETGLAEHSLATTIKIRTLGKALSLNGSRLALIIGDASLIAELNKHAGILYGSLDVAMVKLGAVIAEHPERFKVELATLRGLVNEAFLVARALLEGSPFQLVKPENGFLSYIIVDTTLVGRFALYQALLRENVHAIFGAHFGLRQLYHRELIRVNYLLDIRSSLLTLRDIGDRLMKRDNRINDEHSRRLLPAASRPRRSFSDSDAFCVL